MGESVLQGVVFMLLVWAFEWFMMRSTRLSWILSFVLALVYFYSMDKSMWGWFAYAKQSTMLTCFFILTTVNYTHRILPDTYGHSLLSRIGAKLVAWQVGFMLLLLNLLEAFVLGLEYGLILNSIVCVLLFLGMPRCRDWCISPSRHYTIRATGANTMFVLVFILWNLALIEQTFSSKDVVKAAAQIILVMNGIECVWNRSCMYWPNYRVYTLVCVLLLSPFHHKLYPILPSLPPFGSSLVWMMNMCGIVLGLILLRLRYIEDKSEKSSI